MHAIWTTGKVFVFVDQCLHLRHLEGFLSCFRNTKGLLLLTFKIIHVASLELWQLSPIGINLICLRKNSAVLICVKVFLNEMLSPLWLTARYSFMQILCNTVANSYIHSILRGHIRIFWFFLTLCKRVSFTELWDLDMQHCLLDPSINDLVILHVPFWSQFLIHQTYWYTEHNTQ